MSHNAAGNLPAIHVPQGRTKVENNVLCPGAAIEDASFLAERAEI